MNITLHKLQIELNFTKKASSLPDITVWCAPAVVAIPEVEFVNPTMYILPEASSIEAPKKEKSKNSIFSFLKKRP